MTLNLEAADAYCRTLTRRHYENFSVASRFVDARTRRDLTRIYAYCRTTDDLGDESRDGNALAAPGALARRSRGALRRHAAGASRARSRSRETIERHAMRGAAVPRSDRRQRAGSVRHALSHLGRADRLLPALGGAGWAHGPERLRRARRRGAAPLRRRVHRAAARQSRAGRQPRRRDRPALSRRERRRRGGIAGAAQAMVERARALLASGEALERYVPAAAAPAARALPHGRLGDLRCDRGDRV